jgi:hypothetical protein
MTKTMKATYDGLKTRVIVTDGQGNSVISDKIIVTLAS